MINVVVEHPEKCTGCRLCEIMCSYHHKKVFSRKMSSIEVSEFLKEENRRIIIHDKEENGHLACDCEKPVCVDYCFTEAIVGKGGQHG